MLVWDVSIWPHPTPKRLKLMEKLLWQYRLPYKTQFEIKSAEQIWNVMGGVDEGERYSWVYLHQTKKYDTIICRTWLSAVFMENYWNTALNHSHTQTHTRTHTLSLSVSLLVRCCKQWCYPFIPPSNQRSLSIPMTTLLRLAFIHSWQHNCRSQDNT